MLDRRRFSFGALLLAASAPARASSYGDATAQAPAPPAPPLSARYEVTQRRDVLEVRLFLANTNPQFAISVLTRSGSRLGPTLVAHRVGAPEGEALAEVVTIDRKELFSRVGPRPTYETLVKAELEIGTYRFSAPEGRMGAVELQLTVPTDHDLVELPLATIAVDGRVGA